LAPASRLLTVSNFGLAFYTNIKTIKSSNLESEDQTDQPTDPKMPQTSQPAAKSKRTNPHKHETNRTEVQPVATNRLISLLSLEYLFVVF
jgi:hypothetical protein